MLDNYAALVSGVLIGMSEGMHAGGSGAAKSDGAHRRPGTVASEPQRQDRQEDRPQASQAGRLTGLVRRGARARRSPPRT